jgi:hypothetical protein
MRGHGVAAQSAERSECPPFEARAFATKDGWTVVVWPGYFPEIAAAHALSDALGALVVTTHEYDNDYWTLVVFDDGRRLVQFASWPAYWGGTVEEIRKVTREWSGPPGRLAKAFELPVSTVAPYLVHNASGKAFPEDGFARENFWVFTDLWRRLGITYPEDLDSPVQVLQVGTDFLDKLPHEGEL